MEDELVYHTGDLDLAQGYITGQLAKSGYVDQLSEEFGTGPIESDFYSLQGNSRS